MGPALEALEALLAPLPMCALTFDAQGAAVQLTSAGGLYFVQLPGGGQLERRRSSLDEAFEVCAEAKLTPDLASVEASFPGSKAEARNRIADAMVAALVEVLGLAVPDEKELGRQRKAFRARKKERSEAAALERETAKQRLKDAEAAREARVLAEARADVVTSVPALIEALERRLGSGSRVSNAVKMLKKDGFQLFHDVSDSKLTGVVRSQSEPDRLYACALASDGAFSCCTQNLNVCGGLNGRPCKHLLVLLLGLAQSGALGLEHANEWMVASLVREPKLDREGAAQVFLRYRGATSGELEWRPTETTPEDFYAY